MTKCRPDSDADLGCRRDSAINGAADSNSLRLLLDRDKMRREAEVRRSLLLGRWTMDPVCIPAPQQRALGVEERKTQPLAFTHREILSPWILPLGIA